MPHDRMEVWFGLPNFQENWNHLNRWSMARGRKSKTNNGAKLGFKEQLWAMADAQRGHMDAECA